MATCCRWVGCSTLRTDTPPAVSLWAVTIGTGGGERAGGRSGRHRLVAGAGAALSMAQFQRPAHQHHLRADLAARGGRRDAVGAAAGGRRRRRRCCGMLPSSFVHASQSTRVRAYAARGRAVGAARRCRRRAVRRGGHHRHVPGRCGPCRLRPLRGGMSVSLSSHTPTGQRPVSMEGSTVALHTHTHTHTHTHHSQGS
jgi:hypothetical protein